MSENLAISSEPFLQPEGRTWIAGSHGSAEGGGMPQSVTPSISAGRRLWRTWTISSDVDTGGDMLGVDVEAEADGISVLMTSDTLERACVAAFGGGLRMIT